MQLNWIELKLAFILKVLVIFRKILQMIFFPGCYCKLEHDVNNSC